MNYQKEIYDLLEEQKLNWPLLHNNTKSLLSTRVKTFSFNHFTMRVQFNPERIISSAAKVDKDSISKRQCFLCKHHRPAEQKGIMYADKYEFLCNPFPIFNKHYTITHINHIPQEIFKSFGEFLDISKLLPDLVLFYNSPNCGASAPDHLHFQAGNLGLLPLEKELHGLEAFYATRLFEKQGIKISAIDDSLRKFIVLESDSRAELIKTFEKIYKRFSILTQNDEPMLNILSYFQDSWKVLIFFRGKHRPWQYFETGESNILLSPASVDMGGTLITPLEKDFTKITTADIEDIFQQISFSLEGFNELQLILKTEF